MIDIKLIRENDVLVKENIKKKFQDEKLVLVDEVKQADIRERELKKEGDDLRSRKNICSGEIGILLKEGKKDEAESAKEEVKSINERLVELEREEDELQKYIRDRMFVIPNIMDSSVPIGVDDIKNV